MGYDYPEHIYRYTYEYSDNSNLLAQRNDYYVWYGELSETPFRRTIYNYDENSNLILESTQDYMMYMGSGGQWQNNQRYVMSYDGALLSSRVLQFFILWVGMDGQISIAILNMMIIVILV